MAKVESLNGKVVWITGASSGIGKAIAQQCAAQGAQVILTARRHEELENVRQSLINPDQHISITADITDESQVRHAYEQVVQQKGRIDWLINNAGLSQRALIAETTMQTERAIMEVDYFSQVFLTKTVLPTFLAQKAAIHMWANSLRAEVADQGIGVSVIFPGFVKTNVSLNALNGQGKPQGHADEAIENGLSAEDFARQTVQALQSGEEYIVIGGKKEKLGVLVSRISPKVLYKMIRRTKVK